MSTHEEKRFRLLMVYGNSMMTQCGVSGYVVNGLFGVDSVISPFVLVHGQIRTAGSVCLWCTGIV